MLKVVLFKVVLVLLILPSLSAAQGVASMDICIEDKKDYCIYRGEGVEVGRGQYVMYNQYLVLGASIYCTVGGARVYLQECSKTINMGPNNVPNAIKEDEKKQPTRQCGSIIEQDNRIVHESIPVVGTGLELVYSSDRAIGYAADMQLNQRFPSSQTYATSIDVEYKIGTDSLQTSSITAASTAQFQHSWNGQVGGVTRYKSAKLVVDSKVRNSSVSSTACYQKRGTSQIICASDTAYSHGIFQIPYSGSIGGFRAVGVHLNGWTLSKHHFFDEDAGKIEYGSGETQKTPYKVDGTKFLVASQDGSEVYEFDSDGMHLRTLNGLLGTTKLTFTYSSGKLSSITDAFSNTIAINRDLSGNLSSIVAPNGQTTTIALDTNGYISLVTNPANEAYEITYNTGGLIATFEKPRGQTTSFTFNSLGEFSGESNTNGYSWLLSLTTGPGSKTINMTTAVGRKTSVEISPLAVSADQIRKVTTPDNYYRTTTYLANGNETISAINHTGSRSHGGDPRLNFGSKYTSATQYADTSRTINTSQTRAVTYQNPSLPHPFEVATLTVNNTIDSKTTSTVFTTSTMKYVTTSPVGRGSEVEIDTHERPISSKFATFTPVALTYDTKGRVSTVSQGLRSTEYTYNTAGYLQSVENGLGQTTSYTYDLAGRVLSETLPDNRVIAYSYDANGNLTSITPPSSATHDFSVNLKDLASSYLSPSLGSGTLNTQYAYNNDGQLTQVVRPSGTTINYTYDAVKGVLNSFSDGTNTHTLTHYYVHQPRKIDSPNGVSIEMWYQGEFLWWTRYFGSATPIDVDLRYNTSGLLSGFAISYGTVIPFVYDNDGLVTGAGAQTFSRSVTTGLTSSTALDSVGELFTYSSAFGELESYQGKYSTSNLLNEVYTRDLLGRVSTRTVTVGTNLPNVYEYTYDLAGRLIDVEKDGVATANYVYDSNSNRTSVTRGSTTTSGTYDAQDRISSWGTNTYLYNLNGERTSKVDSSISPGTTTYAWDSWSNLKSVTLPNTDIHAYYYDGFHRRVVRLKNAVVQERYAYLDQTRLTATFGSTGAVQKIFVWGERSNSPEYVIIGSTKYKYIVDHVGSIRMVVNSTTGAIAQEIEYDEFGRVLSDSSPGFQPLGFAGGLYDSTTGLVHFGARSYDPEVGRWLSKDPILFEGGDTNLYGYVLQDPINLIDVEGLSARNAVDHGGHGGPGGVVRSGPVVYVNPTGQAIRIPGPHTVTPTRGSGMNITSTEMGVNGRPAWGVRIMSPTNSNAAYNYPQGYLVNYQNGHPINSTGGNGSQSNYHIPLNTNQAPTWPWENVCK